MAWSIAVWMNSIDHLHSLKGVITIHMPNMKIQSETRGWEITSKR